MDDRDTASPKERDRKHVAFLYPKATEDTFSTIITRRPNGSSPSSAEELHRIADFLPPHARVSASSSGAASLHAILKGLEYVAATAETHDIASAYIFADIRHLVSAWSNNHAYWLASGTFLLRSGDVVKEEPSWRVILETHRKLPLSFLFGSAAGRDYTATMMRLAKDSALRVRATKEAA